MSKSLTVKSFLKVLEKTGYPNPKIVSIANLVGYDLDKFLIDLQEELGSPEKVTDFCEKAVAKISGEKGIRVDLDINEFVYMHIYPIFYDENESENDVISNSQWGESKIFNVDEDGSVGYMSIQEIINQTDMSGWGDLDEMLDSIKREAQGVVFKNCGFGIWFQ